MAIAIRYGDQNLRVLFRYSQPKRSGVITECKIVRPWHDANDKRFYQWDLLGRGVSACHPYDRYDKGLGRRIALTRALRDAGLDYGARRGLWESYFKECMDFHPFGLSRRQRRRILQALESAAVSESLR